MPEIKPSDKVYPYQYITPGGNEFTILSYNPDAYAQKPGKNYKGEIKGKLYNPGADKYYDDPRQAKIDQQNAGIYPQDPKGPDLMDTVGATALGTGVALATTKLIEKGILGKGLLEGLNDVKSILGYSPAPISTTIGPGLETSVQNSLNAAHMIQNPIHTPTIGSITPAQAANVTPSTPVTPSTASISPTVSTPTTTPTATSGLLEGTTATPTATSAPTSSLATGTPATTSGLHGLDVMAGASDAPAGASGSAAAPKGSYLGGGLTVAAGLLGLYNTGKAGHGGGAGAIQGGMAGATAGAGATLIAAEAGSSFGPWGLAIGATAGALYGAIASKAKTHQEDKTWRVIVDDENMKDVPKEALPFWNAETGQQEFDHRGRDEQLKTFQEQGLANDFKGYVDDPFNPGKKRFVNMQFLNSGKEEDLVGGDIAQSATATARFGKDFWTGLNQEQRDKLGQVVIDTIGESDLVEKEKRDIRSAEIAKFRRDFVGDTQSQTFGLKLKEHLAEMDLSPSGPLVKESNGMIHVDWTSPLLQERIEQHLVDTGMLTQQQLEDMKIDAQNQTDEEKVEDDEAVDDLTDTHPIGGTT